MNTLWKIIRFFLSLIFKKPNQIKKNASTIERIDEVLNKPVPEVKAEITDDVISKNDELFERAKRRR